MSYAWLFGLLVGILAGVGVGVVAWLGARKLSKRQETESDERTQMMRTQASATAFYVTAGLAALGWLYQIADGYLKGAEAPVVTPWSIMLAAMLFIYLGANLYQQWKNTVWSDLDAQERAQLQRKAALLLTGVGASSGSARLAFESGADAVGWFLIALVAVGVILGLTFMVVAKRRTEA